MKHREPQLIGIAAVVMLGIMYCGLISSGMIGFDSRASVPFGGVGRSMQISVEALLPITILGALATLTMIPDPTNRRQVGGIVLIVVAGAVASLLSFVISPMLSCVLSLPILIGAAYLLYQSTGVH